MKLRIMERWGYLQLLPEKGNLATMNIVNNLRQKLGTSAEEQEDVGMVVGVICATCRNPVLELEDKDEDGGPLYKCNVCNKTLTKEETLGEKDRTSWNQEKDVGKEIVFKPAERGIVIAAFNALDEKEEVTPQLAALWTMFREAYPEKGKPEKESEDEE